MSLSSFSPPTNRLAFSLKTLISGEKWILPPEGAGRWL